MPYPVLFLAGEPNLPGMELQNRSIGIVRLVVGWFRPRYIQYQFSQDFEIRSGRALRIATREMGGFLTDPHVHEEGAVWV